MTASGRLRPLHRWCDLARVSGDPELVAIGANFAQWLEGGGSSSLAEALGLPDLAWVRMVAALEARDRALCEMSRRFGLAAPEVARVVLDYEQTGWKSDVAAVSCPARLIGTPQEHAWSALRSRPHAPCERHVREILKNGNRDR